MPPKPNAGSPDRPTPPRLADRLLEWFVAPHLLETLQGDLHEEFAYQVERVGERRARWRYWRDVLGFVRPYVIRREKSEYPNPSTFTMIQNYVKVAIRSLVKNKVYTFTNLSGLSVGLAACGLIALYIVDEWRVDRFHEKGDRIYRVVTNTVEKGAATMASNTVGRPVAEAIRQEVPDVEAVIPVRRANLSIRHNNRYFFDKELFVSNDFLTTFSFPLIEGDPKTALRDPYAVVLTESTARKYFGTTAVLGRTLMLQDTLPFKITGVTADPQPSHIDFNLLLSLPTFYALEGKKDGQWFTWDEYCYVLLPERADPVAAEKKIAALPMKHNGQEYRNNGIYVTHSLEPLPWIYLHSFGMPDMGGANNRSYGSAKQLYVVGLIGLFLLLLAGINFVNLTTSYQGQRAKEVGIRKAIGAAYSSLIGQFLGESLMLAYLAGFLAILIMAAALPLLNNLTGKAIPLTTLFHPVTIGLSFVFLLLTGLLAGWYPALVLARFRPVETLKGQHARAKGAWLRQGLVVFQFSISLSLIVGTIVVVRQLRFMQSQELGFTKERVLTVELRKLPRLDFINNYESIKQQVASLPNVQAVTGVSALPGRDGWNGQMVYPQGRPREQAFSLEVIPVDHDYVKTLGLAIRNGRDYSTQFTTDAGHAVLLNEAACKAIGWKPAEAVGKSIGTPGLENGQVVGVIKDFHQHGLQQKITPILTFITPAYTYRYLAIRLGAGDVHASVAQIEQFWQRRFPGYDFDYYFLDEDFNRQYQTEQRVSTLVSLFAGIAIFIACLGLFALTTFTTEQRTKEIGVRKVLGATVVSVVALLSKDFLKLVLIAIIVASPLAWWAMNLWLQDFAYKIDLDWWVFAVAGLLALIIALLTVSYQSIKAALMNPVKSLRSE
ncbi:Macrolide export ATP-binding/permease protein macB [Fibrisoma limi BUZ 3]|uniref:Macrolide export ATP-binding/permease protein macB n=1 Tax=Fibrisoma limi BUZ 3 TaxID=1185876 RepID=I2GEY4_9BACT|nr:ABC transporter permease [Fibrisoma limi]CCH52459.1 Macrolide export ATP-binding/permease protein macB [Fibrisoma limi BUZ 3]